MNKNYHDIDDVEEPKSGLLLPDNNVGVVKPKKSNIPMYTGLLFGAISGVGALYMSVSIAPIISTIPVVGPILSELAIGMFCIATAFAGFVIGSQIGSFMERWFGNNEHSNIKDGRSDEKEGQKIQKGLQPDKQVKKEKEEEDDKEKTVTKKSSISSSPRNPTAVALNGAIDKTRQV